MRFEVMRAAERDIEKIIAYTDETFGQAQTRTYLSGLYYSFDLLTDNPEMAPRFDIMRRRYVYKAHYVYYRIDQDVLKILRVLHTKLRQPAQR